MEQTMINEPAILIRINRTFKPVMDADTLFDYTRGKWRIKTEIAQKAKYAFSIYKGIVLEVYEIKRWHVAGTTKSSRKPNDNPELKSTKDSTGRYEFTGSLASDELREKYKGKSVKHYFVRGNSNPVNYINI